MILDRRQRANPVKVMFGKFKKNASHLTIDSTKLMLYNIIS